ncbi:hypothetical protein H0H93_014021 [Arthromyces matolae]|nr:hypothetical protein H0H93_014021 [Arthromyces matolae]
MPALRAEESAKHKESVTRAAMKAQTIAEIVEPLVSNPVQLSMVETFDQSRCILQSTLKNNIPTDFDDIEFDDGHDHFLDFRGEPVIFSAGEQNHNQIDESVSLHEQISNLYLLHEHQLFGTFSNLRLDNGNELEGLDDREDSTMSRVADMMTALGVAEEEDDDDDEMFNEEGDPKWFPHGSRTRLTACQMFMLDLLDNLPRLRLSDEHMKAFLWVMRECGTPNVPSFSALRKLQKNLTQEVCIETKHHTSSLGNHFFVNHPAKLLALDFGNPLVRPMMRFYPEVGKVPIREPLQAQKMTSMSIDLDELSPMWADWKNKKNSHRHYYVNELAKQDTGSFVVILRWITVEGIDHADVLEVRFNPEAELDELVFAGKAFDLPNPLRKIAKGRPMFRTRIMPWSDDVSGNVSKQYNAHTNLCFVNVNLPHRALSQEYFVHFCSTSPHASSSEQFAALSEDFDKDIWHGTFDCELEEDILFQIIPHLLPADNPQQSETSSHIGVVGNYNCRRDHTGGTNVERESDKGYKSLYLATGTKRTPEETLSVIKNQYMIACTGNQEALRTSYSETGVKDKIAQFWLEQLLVKAKSLQKVRLSDESTRDPRLNDKNLKGEARKKIKEEIEKGVTHELWEWVLAQVPDSYANVPENDRIDPHQDTPVEILHTWLLGNNKYVWHSTSHGWDKKKEDVFAVRLASSTLDGLTIPPPRAQYLVKYKNSLIGKHFRILQQLGIFHVHGLCSDDLFNLWKATGELGALIWYPEIADLDEYLVDLQVLIDNLLDRWAEVDPRRIIVKIKLHALTHLVDDIRRFGPAILYSTEIFECFNAVFRVCSILSNHISPSHDIGVTMADLERFKHIVSGGWWKAHDGTNTQAGCSIRSFLVQNPRLRHRLGWADGKELEAGTIKLKPRAKRQSQKWTGIYREYGIEEPEGDTNSTWDACSYVCARSQDPCREGSWIFLTVNGNTSVGRILKVLARTGTDNPLEYTRIIVRPYDIGEVKDARLNMPILTPSAAYPACIIAKPEDLLFVFNAQHDCVGLQCEIQDSERFETQERISTTIHKKMISHRDADRYIINMHALHNCHLIRKVLPRELIKPVPFKTNRDQFHSDLASDLRVTGPERRAQTQAKARETRERNKAAKAKEAVGAADGRPCEE